MDISFTVCFFVSLSAGLWQRRNGYLGRGLTQGNEILQDGRCIRLPGILLFW